MTTSIDKINSGLRSRAGKPHIPIAHLKGAPRSLSDLNELADQAQSKGKRLAELVDGVESHMEAFEARKRREFDSLPIDKAQKAKALREALKQERAHILAVGKEERDALLADIQSLNAKIQAVKAMWADPVGILVRSSLGSEKADRYRRDMESSGPVAVEQALQQSILAGDKDLAAACFSRIDAMPRKVRESVRVSRAEVASHLVSNTWNRATRSILGVEIAAESAEFAAAKATGRDLPSTRKLSLGMKRKEWAKLNQAVEESNAERTEGEAA